MSRGLAQLIGKDVHAGAYLCEGLIKTDEVGFHGAVDGTPLENVKHFLG